MDVNIAFPEIEMAQAFIEALEKLGYDYTQNENEVSFIFDEPLVRNNDADKDD